MEVDDNDEFGFMNLSDEMTFASGTSILRDPHLFIGDSGAISDTTSFLDGLKMLRK